MRVQQLLLQPSALLALLPPKRGGVPVAVSERLSVPLGVPATLEVRRYATTFRRRAPREVPERADWEGEGRETRQAKGKQTNAHGDVVQKERKLEGLKVCFYWVWVSLGVRHAVGHGSEMPVSDEGLGLACVYRVRLASGCIGWM